MSYRNKTYVAFASEDIKSYYLMTAWKANENIDFEFHNAHDLYVARDTSKPETIKHNLRERLKNTKQVVLLGSPDARSKGGDGVSFLAYEVQVIMELNLPVVIANLDGSRDIVSGNIPKPFEDADYYTLSVSFGPKIIQYALDNYVPAYRANPNQAGPHYYMAPAYA